MNFHLNLNSRRVLLRIMLVIGAITTTVYLVDSAIGAKPESKMVPVSNCRIKLIDVVTLASGRPGILDFVEPQEGDRVAKNQQIAGLMDRVAMAQLAIAEKRAGNDVEVRYSQAAADVAIVEYQKGVMANEKFPGTIPDIELKRLGLQAVRSKLQLEQSQHNLEVAQLESEERQLETFRVKAPFDGVVSRVYKAKGEAVNQGDPILELVSTQRVRVEGYIDLEHAWAIKSGMRVKVQLNIPDVDLPVEEEIFAGRIIYVDVAVQPVTRQVRVWAEVANRNDILRAGLTASMVILPNKPANGKTASRFNR